MVPLDVPNVAFHMMQNLLYNKSFKQSLQRLDRSVPDESKECPVCPTCPKSEGKSSSTEH